MWRTKVWSIDAIPSHASWIWRFPKMRVLYPQIINFNRIFHCKPSSYRGYPHCRKPAYKISISQVQPKLQQGLCWFSIEISEACHAWPYAQGAPWDPWDPWVSSLSTLRVSSKFPEVTREPVTVDIRKLLLVGWLRVRVGFTVSPPIFEKSFPVRVGRLFCPNRSRSYFFPFHDIISRWTPCYCWWTPPKNIYIQLHIYIYIYGYSLIKSSLQWNGRLSLGALNQTIPIYIYMYIYICIVLHGPFPNAPWVGVSFCLSPGCFRGDGTRFRNLLPVDAKRGGRWDYCWHHGPMGIRWRYLGHFWVFKNDFSACLLMPWSLTDSHGLGRDRGLDWMISGRSQGVLATEIRQT